MPYKRMTCFDNGHGPGRTLPIEISIKVGGKELVDRYDITDDIILDKRIPFRAEPHIEKAIRPIKEKAAELLNEIVREIRKPKLSEVSEVICAIVSDIRKERSVQNANDDNR